LKPTAPIPPAADTQTALSLVFLTEEWRHLAMVNFEIRPDFWNKKCLVNLAGFSFLKTRVFGMPVPLHRNF
jgi:hypothetical protein